MNTTKKESRPVSRKLFWYALAFHQVAAVSPALANGLNGHMGAPGGFTPNSIGPHHFTLTEHSKGLHAANVSNGHETRPNSLADHFGLSLTSLPLTQNNKVESVQLDLTSNASSVVLDAGIIKNGSSISIDVGGQESTFHTGDSVTPAELLAVLQVQSGQQTIKLDSQGQADGGSFSLNKVMSGSSPVTVTGITVPQNVNATDVLSSKSSISLSGDLINYGTISDVARSGHTSASISAQDIINESGAIITTVGHGSQRGTADLGLTATQDFLNQGTIASSGALSVTAGGSVKNAGAGASISAVKDVTINSASIANSGTISSSNGNVNLNNASGSLSVANAGGTISAANAINVNPTGTAVSTVTGGDLLSQQLNLNSGTGTINIDVNNLTGSVSSTGNAVHVEASTKLLEIGTQTLTGDPTYYNTAGDITIDGSLTINESVTIIASGNVGGTSQSITTTTASNQTGFPVTIIAGANVSGAPKDNTTDFPFGNTAGGNVTVNGPSSSGGSVTLTNITINTAGTGTNLNGGSVTIAAFQNTTGSGGGISFFGTSAINSASGSGTGVPGAITMVAPNGITLPQLTSVGNLLAITSQPVTNDGNPIIFTTTGAVQGTNFITGNFAAITSGGIGLGAGGASVVSGTAVLATNNANIILNGALTAKAISAATQGNINIGANLSGSLGISLVAGQNISTTAAGLTISSNSLGPKGGDGGDITIVAGAAFTETASQITVTGASVNGGNIDFATNPIVALTSQATSNGAGSFSGGVVTMAAFSAGSNGNVSVAGSITTGGFLGSQASKTPPTNGNVLIVAGNNQGSNAITITEIQSTGNLPSLSGGNVTLVAAAPNVAPNVVMQNATGAITTGNFYQGQLATNGNINVQNITSGASATLLTAGNVAGTYEGLPSGQTSLTAPGGIVLVAGGNITLFNTNSTNSQVGNSGNIMMVAGANFTNTAAGTITVTGASATGGTIQQPGGTIPGSSFDSSNSIGNGNGGNITLIAFGAGGGILTTTGSITSGGSGVGFTNGNVLMVAGGSGAGTGITIGAITTSDTAGVPITGTTGSITLVTATPDTTTPVQFDQATGNVAAGNFYTGQPLTNGALSVGGNLQADNTSIILQGGLRVNLLGVKQDFGNTSLLIDSGLAANPASGKVTLNATAKNPINVNIVTIGALNSVVLGNGVDITAPGGLSIVSGGNIMTNAGGTNISTSSLTGAGGNITLVAGAAFTSTLGTITITGGSATGGTIDFNTNAIAQLTAQSAFRGGAGGNITLVSFAGTTAASGQVLIPGSITIASGGNGNGKNGDVTIVAGGSSTGDAINSAATGGINIDTTGGLAGTGNITLSATTPNVPPNVTIDRNTAAITSGNFLGGTINASNINVGTLSTNNANITIAQGAAFNFIGDLGTGSNLVIDTTNTININSPITSNSVSMLTTAGINIGADVEAPGGILMIAGGNIGTTVAGVNLSTSSATGDSGNIAIIAGAIYQLNSTSVTVTGPTTTPSLGLPIPVGGSIDFNTNGIASLTSQSTAAAGNGGTITVVAFGGLTPGAGLVSINPAVTINSSGSAIGTKNGDITIAAGGSPGNLTSISVGNLSASALGTNTGAIALVGITPSNANLVISTGLGAGTVQSGNFAPDLLHIATITTVVTGDITTPGSIAINAGSVRLGNLNVTNADTFNAGQISVQTNSATAMTIGSAGPNNILSIDISGATTGNAGIASLTNVGTGGITVQTGPSVISFGVTSGNGAQLTLNAGSGPLSLANGATSSTFDVSGAGANGVGGQISFSGGSITWTSVNTQALSLIANGAGANGGQITVSDTTANPLNIGTAAGNISLTANAGAGGGKGGMVEFDAVNSAVTVDGTAISVLSAGNGNGGTINLNGGNILALNAATQPLVLTATGSGNGNGGVVSVTTSTAGSALTVGTAPGNVEAIATSGLGNVGGGGSGNGGTATFDAAGNLTVNPAGIIANPLGLNGNGATINLIAGGNGTGTLLVTSTLAANGVGTGSGGSITLDSNSSTVFTIGTAKTNSIKAVSVLGTQNGVLTVENFGTGGIIQSTIISGVGTVNYTAASAGSITVKSALGDVGTSDVNLTTTGTGAITGTGLITATNADFTSTGVIGGKTAMKVAVSDLTANGAGQVNLTDSLGVAIAASGSTTSTFTVTAGGNLVTSGVIEGTSVTLATSAANGSILLGDSVTASSATGTVTLTAKGTGSITDQNAAIAPISATNVKLSSSTGQLGTAAVPLNINTGSGTGTTTGSLSALTKGPVNIDDTGTGDVTLTGASSTSSFTLTAAGTSINTGKVSLSSATAINLLTTNNGNIVINSSEGGTKTVTLTLQANGSGSITAAKSKKLTSVSTISLISGTGSIGTPGTSKTELPISVSAPLLSINTGGAGDVLVVNSFAKAVTLQNSSSGNSFNYTSGSGGLTLNNISVGTTGTAASGGISITASGNMATVAGDTITYGNAVTPATGGGITFNNTKTTGTIVIGTDNTITTTTAAGGNAAFVVGKLPGGQVAGTAPTAVTSSGTVFYNNGITANLPQNTVTTIGTASITFSAAKASQIILNGGDTIIADPPPSASGSLYSANVGGSMPKLDSSAIMPGQLGVNSGILTSSVNGSAANTTDNNLGTSNSLSTNNGAVNYVSALSNLNLANLFGSQLNLAASNSHAELYSSDADGSSADDNRTTHTSWISDTELDGGEIPVMLLTDVDLGVQSFAEHSSKISAASQDLSASAMSIQPANIQQVLSTQPVSTLMKGSALSASNVDSVIKTPIGDVSIRAKSLVIVMSFDKGMAVYNLHDTREGAVTVSAGGKQILIPPGRCIVITHANRGSFDEINPAQLVAYRNLSEQHVNEQLKVYAAEFSPLTAVNAVKPLKALLASKNHNAVQLSNKFLKTASIMLQLQSGGSAFRQVLRPAMLAYLRR